ncbi:transglutaminase domain-containing protein [Ruminococcus bromii]|uniref:transglutaminase domain-containing protein n=1 Tax=Ruminococcus bromii TaxID=40518 RepID=UPI00266FF6D6|nr:transglutaminase domain-containing protein [Ruminococcus bromii]
MRKFLSIVTSGALALLMTTTSVMTGFAYDGNNESAKATDAVSLEVVSDNTIPAEEPTGPNETVPTVPCEPTVNYPQISGFSNTSTGTKISWNSYSGAVKYRVYVFNGKSWSRVGESTTTNFTHNSLRNGVTYRYTVRAMDKNNKFVSDYNKEGYSNTFFAPPVISSLQNVFGGVTVKWSKNSAIDSYRIYRKTKNTGWKRIGTSDSGSFTDTTAESGISYTYTLRALDAENNFVSYCNGGKSVTYVKAPTINKIENTVTGSKISWGKCSGASKYRVYYLKNRSWKALGNTTATSFTHNKLKSETKYTYTVRCLDSKGNFVSGYDKNGTSNIFLNPPKISSLANINGGVEIKWNTLKYADGYRVYRKTKNTGWTRIGNTEDNTFKDTNVKSGTAYTYTVRCVDEDGNFASYFNNGKSVTFVKTPTINKIENTATGSKISWGKCSGASKYRVYYLKNRSWKALGNTTATSFTHNKLKSETKYTYTVRCLDSKGKFASGYDKNGTSNTFIAPPAISKVSKAANGNLVKWNRVPDAAGYRLYRKTVNTSWSRLADVTEGTSYTDTSAKKGNVYSYTLRCLDKNGNLISSYISNTKYYHNGALANGKIAVNGKPYYFSKGLFRSGYQKINGKRYYYNSKGEVVKNTIVGSKREGWYYADKNGVCCESEEMRLAAEYMMTYCKGNTLNERMKTGFLYMAKNFPYHRTYDHPKKAADLPALAIDLFKNKKGNCFRYAAAFACTARIAGYRSRVVIGDTLGSPHGWVEVLVNGKWLICDPDAQLPGYKVPDYKPYMMKKHYWTLNPHVKCEVTIENGKAVWK